MVLAQTSRTDDFLKALGVSTRGTYKIGLSKCEDYLRTLPRYAGSIDPLFDFLRDVKGDKLLSVEEMTYVERKIIGGLFEYLGTKGYSNKYILSISAALQSYGKFWQVPLSTKFTNPPDSVAKNEKHEWTLQELGDFIEKMDSSQYQSLAASVLQSTLRMSDLIGDNFLYGQIQPEFEAEIVPVCILIKSSEKTGVRHRTFLGSLAVQKMKKYFEDYGTPKTDEPIYPICDRSVDDYFAKHAKSLGYTWGGQNPRCIHGVRAAADTFLSDALCPESAIEYFSGHNSGDIKLSYRKRATDSWRKFYGKFEWALDYTLKPEDRPKTSLQEIKALLEAMEKETVD